MNALQNIDKGTYTVTLIPIVGNDSYARVKYTFTLKDKTYNITINSVKIIADSTEYKSVFSAGTSVGGVLLYTNDSTFISNFNTLKRPVNFNITVS